MRTLLLVFALALSPSLALAFTAAETAETARPLGVDSRVPSLIARDPTGAEVSLNERFRQKTTVLVIFRGGWCPFCTKHLSALAEAESRFNELDVQVLAVSTDTPEKLAKVASDTHSSFQLFSDRSLSTAGPLGLAFKLSEETALKYKGWGIDAPVIEGEAGRHWLPVPAVYIIDKNEVVRFAYSESNYKKRIEVAELLTELEKLTR